MKRILCLVLGTAIVLCGCATREDFVAQSNKVNQSVEDAHNQILLTNVVRAYRRVPMHFTGIQIVRGPIGSASPTFGFKIPFGPDFKTNIYEFTPSIKPDVALIDFAIYDKQDFMRGITKPLDAKLMQYYVDQGWPLQMVLYLFVREVQITNIDKTVTRKINYPQNQEQFDDFKIWVQSVSGCRLRLKSDTVEGEFFGPPIETDAFIKDPTKYIAARKDGFNLIEQIIEKEDKTKVTQYRLRKVTEREVFELRHASKDEACIAPSPPPDQPAAAPKTGDSASAQNAVAPPVATGFTALSVGTGQTVGALEKEAPKTAPESKIFLRSAEAIVYYLGEIMRAKYEGARQSDGTYKSLNVEVMLSDPKYQNAAGVALVASAPLFNVETDVSKLPEGIAMSVAFDKQTYHIPAGRTGGRSMHTLSLVTQLIGINKNATELPQSPTVRLLP